MSWLDKLLLLSVQSGGSAIGQRPTLNFTGATVTDDSANNRVNVAISGGLTQLTGDVTAGPGSGSVAATVAKVNGVSVTGTPTAGQVIRATSGTASSWAAVARGDITNTSGATGDIITGNATTLTRLGIGSTGQVLTVSGGTPAWTNPSQTVRTTYELDFGAVAAETVLSGAGTATRTYNGVTWTFTNTTTGGAVSQVTSAAGLTQNCTPNTVPAIDATLTSLGVYDALAGSWRAWIYFDQYTLNDDNYMDLVTPFSIIRRAYTPTFSANYYSSTSPNIAGAYINSYQAGYTAYDILVTECVSGNFINRLGLYSAGAWTNLSACRVMSVGSPSDATMATATSGISLANASVQIRTNKSGGSSVANRIKLFKFEVW